MVKLNIGCGKEVKEGFEGIDILDFGQKHIVDIRKGIPYKNEVIDEIYTRYLLPVLTNLNGKLERVKFFNEMYRVLKPNGIVTLIVPCWNANGGYGNPLFHEPVYEGFLFFLSKEWRELNAPEVTQYICDFEPTWGYNLHPNLINRNQEFQQFALANYCNAALDLIITLKKKGRLNETPKRGRK